jgi:hypothetical protein
MSKKNEEREYRPLGDSFFVKALAILFVLGVYTVIFLKILFLK